MEPFTEEHSKLLLSKEWLVKVDSSTSTPYLFKFYYSTVDLVCCVLFSDTKSTWAEVLTGSQFAHRWRTCNTYRAPPLYEDEDQEESWRARHLEILSKAHTIGGMDELSFEVVKSKEADLAFEFECSNFKWRWETVFTGYRSSADLLSKHLILPLISVNHLAFSSLEPLSEASASDVEKAVDKIGRTARRSLDTHIRNTLSKPRIATALRRMTAMFNFVPDLPGVRTTADTPDLTVEAVKPRTKASINIEQPASPMQMRSPSPAAHKGEAGHPEMDVDSPVDPTPGVATSEQPEASDSVTESEDDAPPPLQAKTGHENTTTTTAVATTKPPSSRALSSTPAESSRPFRQVSAPGSPSPAAKSKAQSKATDSATESDESSKAPPKKTAKKKVVSSDDGDDSDDVAAPKKPSGGAAVRRGARQPIKRGGKRF